MDAQQGIKSMVLEAQITRADGTIENLGPVAEYHEDEDKSFVQTIKDKLKGNK